MSLCASSAPLRLCGFPLLADPERYEPNTIDMVRNTAARDYWLAVFEDQIPRVVKLAAGSEADSADAQGRAAAFGQAFAAVLTDIRRDGGAAMAARGMLSIIGLCTIRENLLKSHGFFDCYKAIKQRENDAAIELLPAILREADAVADPRRRLLLLMTNAFAGNIFDLGCAGTVKMFEAGEINFHVTRERYTQRPWLVDDLDAMADRFEQRRHRKAVMFVDNAGGDIVLGMIPLARFLLQRGTAVIMSANTIPALNDVTHEELIELIDRIAAMDPVIRAACDQGRLTLIGSGNGIPGIDLRRVTPELADAAADADLLIIQGMGRALETNYRARFTCDTLKMAMVKEQDVADLLGGKLYDVVCRFEPAD